MFFKWCYLREISKFLSLHYSWKFIIKSWAFCVFKWRIIYDLVFVTIYIETFYTKVSDSIVRSCGSSINFYIIPNSLKKLLCSKFCTTLNQDALSNLIECTKSDFCNFWRTIQIFVWNFKKIKRPLSGTTLLVIYFYCFLRLCLVFWLNPLSGRCFTYYDVIYPVLKMALQIFFCTKDGVGNSMRQNVVALYFESLAQTNESMLNFNASIG